MYFAHSSVKVPLYNSNEYEVDLENGVSLKILPHNERLLVSYLNYPNDKEFAKRNIHQWLSCVFKNFPLHLQDIFISNFINDHPVEISNQAEIPLHAVAGLFSFHVPTIGDGEIITITEEQEKELVEIIKTHITKSKKKVIQWFTKYYLDRGFNILLYQKAIEEMAVEFIAEKGYIVERSANIEGIFGNLAFLWKVLVSLVGCGILIRLIFSIGKFLFSL
jgi:hypothetical protein